ncbi:MAG: AAA family ATPase [Actinomycetota bacterium]
MSKLTRVRVTGLLDRFDHAFDIDQSWEFVILHGPNGVGKTMLLQLCQAMMRPDHARLRSLPFRSATLAFDDGYIIEADRLPPGEEQLPDVDDGDPSRRRPKIVMRLRRSGSLVSEWSAGFKNTRSLRRYAEMIDDMVPFPRVKPTTWLDTETGEPITIEEIASRYADVLPEELVAEISSIPDDARAFFDAQKVHLIDTERLLSVEPSNEWPSARAARSAQNRPLSTRGDAEHRSTVVYLADELANRIRTALAQNSLISQEQDRTFPQRLLGAQRVAATEAEVRDRYRDQAELRSRLSAVGLLDQTPEVALPLEELEAWQIRVMSIYLQDSALKLANFEELLRKTTLLREVVNARFLNKSMRIDAERGFFFETDRGLTLSPSQLSSGEQHEVVLLYRLLFNARAGSIVLIDEPEISLHIAWQQQVLNDLKRIAEISALQFVIATHSPHIVHHWVDRMVSLSGEAG